MRSLCSRFVEKIKAEFPLLEVSLIEEYPRKLSIEDFPKNPSVFHKTISYYKENLLEKLGNETDYLTFWEHFSNKRDVSFLAKIRKVDEKFKAPNILQRLKVVGLPGGLSLFNLEQNHLKEFLTSPYEVVDVYLELYFCDEDVPFQDDVEDYDNILKVIEQKKDFKLVNPNHWERKEENIVEYFQKTNEYSVLYSLMFVDRYDNAIKIGIEDDFESFGVYLMIVTPVIAKLSFTNVEKLI